jgi:DNA-binding CsgD family transcriptional regulator
MRLVSRPREKVAIGLNNHAAVLTDESSLASDGRPGPTVPGNGCVADPSRFLNGPGPHRIRTIQVLHSGNDTVILLEHLPVMRDIRSELGESGLTRRQREIALMALKGFCNNEISERLFITEQTVKDHLYDIYVKLQIHHRSELAAKLLGLTQSAK